MGQLISNKVVKIYTDFDGTISRRDIINSVLDKYADLSWLELDKLFLKDKISSSECLTGQIALLCDLPDKNILEIAETVGIDKSFIPFFNFCAGNKIDIEIVSDGMDIYINHLLKINNIKVRKINSNIYKGQGIVEFPHNKCLCEKDCANCKKSHLDIKSFIVYIGDGKSDFCPAMSSDLVFAKGSLEKYLRKNQKEFYSFESFSDVLIVLSKLISEDFSKKGSKQES